MAPSFQICAFLLNLAAVQARIYDTRFSGTTWDDSNWRITTTDLNQGHYQSRMSLANGYIGINLAAVGPFFEFDIPVDGDDISGWPLFDRRQTFATVAGFYDEQPTTEGTNFEWLNQYGGESVISGIPHWAGLHVEVGSSVLTARVPASQISNFRSILDMKDGTLAWNYTWSPTAGTVLDVEYLMFVHKLHINQAVVQLKLTARKDMNVSVIDVLNGDCAVRSGFVGKGYSDQQPLIWSAVHPNGIANIPAYTYSRLEGDKWSNPNQRSQYTNSNVIGGNQTSIAQALPLSLKAGQSSTTVKYIGVASKDAFPNANGTAHNSAHRGEFNDLLASHIKEWRSVMPDESVDSYRNPADGSLPNDPNIIEAQITSVTNTFGLLQNTVGANAVAATHSNPKLTVNSIPVGGLGSDSYAGMIFWDADVWMAPGLVVAFPDAAKQITQYRMAKFPQAQKNINTAYQSSQNATGKFSDSAAVYPWTSARFGNCTGTGPCFDYEYHLNGDIGLALLDYYVVTGDTDYFRTNLFPIYDAVAQFFAELVTFNHTANQYYLYNATDPDEYANHKNNVGYTMVLMQTHIATANNLRARFGMAQSSLFSQVAPQIDIPVDPQAGIILEYEGMNATISVKQADVVLVDDLLDYPNPYTQNDLTYYAGKQSLDGPGMTYAVFSIIENTNSSSGCASYTYDLYSSQPYARGPWFQFSEQLIDNYSENGGTHPAFPFLTGMGGANRVAVFGYLGLKLVLESLNVYPSLPPQIPYLEYRTLYWQGWPIKAVSNQTHTTFQRLNGSLPNANSTFAFRPIPLTIGIEGRTQGANSEVYHIRKGYTLTIPNRQSSKNKTVAGNIAQCELVTSKDPYALGQFPLSAVDGSVTTKWQPETAGPESTIQISLPGPFVPIKALQFDWAQNPPVSYTVWFSNGTGQQTQIAHEANVTPNKPYDPSAGAAIVPYAYNSTRFVLKEPVWSGKVAILTIQGNQALKGTGNETTGPGATIAEFAIVEM